MSPSDEKLFGELISLQKRKLLTLGQRLVPLLTEDDIWQPNDFPELEGNPHFRYEEGILTGLLAAEAALRVKSTDFLQ